MHTYYTRYRAFRQVLETPEYFFTTHRFSDLLLTGEFGQPLQPYTNRLLSVEFWRTTPAHSVCVVLYYTITLCYLQGTLIRMGGDEGARTPDLDSAIVALSQLSYIPRHGL